MQRPCVDCGLSLCKNPGGTNWPKRCSACNRLRVSARQRKYAAALSASRKSARLESACADCGSRMPLLVRRGPLRKRCDECSKACSRDRAKSRRESGRCDIHHRNCRKCGSQFVTARVRQKYCSHDCAHLADRNRLKVTCVRCGEVFEETACRANARRFCSWACWRPAAPACKCQQCGKEFKRKARKHAWQGKNKFCSRECAWDHRWGADRPRKATSEKAKRSWAQRSRATTLKHRCRYYECEFDPECTREAVCDRDGWVCQDCGVRCHKGEWRIDKKTRKASPRNAEHDHIWPLSVRGGPGNVMHNSQCLCRKCNGKKRNRRKGQMRINLSV